MRITLFGATGKTGTEIMKQALDKKIKVVAFVRNTDKIRIKDKKLSIVQGDVRKIREVKKAIQGSDAVISSLGTTPGKKPVCEEGTRNIISSMKKFNIDRLLVISAYGASETKKNSLYTNLLARVFLRRIMKDKDKMEKLIKKSKLKWTIVRPTILTNGKLTKKYRKGIKLDLKGFKKVSRADVAYFILEEIRKNRYIGKPVILSY